MSFARLPLTPYIVTGNAPRFAIKYLVETVYGDTDRLTEETVTRYHELFLREGNGTAFFNLVRTPLENHVRMLGKLKMPVLHPLGREGPMDIA